MATDASRLNYINSVDPANTTIFIRLAVYKDNAPSADTVDTNTTATTVTLQQLADLIAPLLPTTP